MSGLLLPHHARELYVGSGISPAVAEARGYRSVTAKQAAALGFAPFQCRGGLAIPQWTLAGVQFGWLLKPDNPRTDDKGKVLKYEAPAGSVPHFDIHPDARRLLREGPVPLYFTEGNKKSDAAWSRGLACVSLTGVWQFVRCKVVVPDLDEIDLKGRLVRVVYDSDVTRKPSVAQALNRFCHALLRRGAIVGVVFLPEGPDGAKVGLDDWFVAGGSVADLEELTRDFEDSVQFEDASPGWGIPTPLPEGERPDFPTEHLPRTLAAWVEALAVATQTPAALAAFLTLSVIAIAAAKRVVVKIREGWLEPVNVFLLVALGSGNRKSAVETAVGKPLRTYEREKAEARRVEIAQAQARRSVAEKRLGRLVSEQASGPVNDAPLQDAIDDLVRDLAEDESLQVPHAHRLLVDDTTPEKLAAMMADQGGRMGVLSAEGGIFQVISGRYSEKRVDSLDLFLKGHAGDNLPVDRISRETKCLVAPALTMGLAVQPEVMAGLATQPGFRGRGLLARFGWAYPASTVGRRQIAPPPVEAQVEAAYEALVERLLALPDETAMLAFSRGAEETLRAFEGALEPRLGPDGDLEHLADWGAKLAGLVARFAGLLHVAANVEGTGERSALRSGEIDSATVSAAIAIAEEFLIPHAKTVFALLGADPAVEEARRVLRCVRSWPEETVNRRDLHQRLRATFPKPADLDRPLALLEEHQYLRRVEQHPAGPGRRPSPLFEINPLGRTQNARNTQNGAEDGHFEDSVHSVQPSPPSSPTPNGHVPHEPAYAAARAKGEWF